jgi:hypothetical protein
VRGVRGLGQLPGAGGERQRSYRGAAGPLERVWIALRAHERKVLQAVTLADIISGDVP